VQTLTEDSGGSSFDDTVDTSSEQTDVCACETDALDDGWRIVVKSVDTGEVLEPHESNTVGKTLPVAGLSDDSDLRHERVVTAGDLEFAIELLLDSFDFVGEVRMVEWHVADTAEDLAGVVEAPSLAQPTWRLGLEEHSDDEKEGRDELEAEGDSPLGVG